MDILDLGMLPTLKCPTRTGNTDESREAVYIMSSLKIKHIQTRDGDRTCPRTRVRFMVQATLEPNDAAEWNVTGYLKNGEMLMKPLIPGDDRKDVYIYPFSPILIGEADDLATPLGLAMLKDSLSHVGFLANKQPPAGEVGPSISFEPGSDDSSNTSSLESTSSPSSSIIAGAPGNPTSEASRIRCGQEIERSLDRALVSGLDPNFQPWMASTGSTPPSARPPSSQSLPTDLEGSGSSGSFPQRPRSTSPTKGRKRKKVY